MQHAAVIGTKAAIVLLLLSTLVIEILIIPVFIFDLAQSFPEFAWLRWPGIIGGVLLCLCVQFALICVWKLLPMTETDQIFDGSAFPWVNRMLGATTTFTIAVVAGGLALLAVDAANPGVLIIGVLAFGGGSGITLLLLVMRGLLVRASDLSREMAEVI